MTAAFAASSKSPAPRRLWEPKVSVVVPAKNEAANIREVLPYLREYYEVIVIVSEDDHDSAEAAREALPSAKVLVQTRKGKGNAMICGFEHVTGDIVVTFDVDGSADPHEIPRFVDALMDGADLAKGSRFALGGGSEDITRFRALGNRGLNLLAGILTGVRFSDLCYGFNAFWAAQLPLLDLPEADRESAEMVPGDGFEIEAMIIGRFALSGAVIAEVPSVEHTRYHGRTNLNAISDGFRVLWTILQDRFRARRYQDIARRDAVPQAAIEDGPNRPRWMQDDQPLRIV